MKSNYTNEYSLFVELLVQTRRNQGLTQKTVAFALKKPQSFVSKYESGERRLDVIEFIQVARALNSDPVQLLRELESK